MVDFRKCFSNFITSQTDKTNLAFLCVFYSPQLITEGVVWFYMVTTKPQLNAYDSSIKCRDDIFAQWQSTVGNV